jgi:hypothetical protein
MGAAAEPPTKDEWTNEILGRSETQIGSAHQLPVWLVALAIPAALAADYLLFRFVLDRDYFRWYIDNGAKFALALTIFSLAVRLDEEPDLIAAEPDKYVASWLAFLGEGFMWLAGLVENGRPRSRWQALDGPIVGLFALVWAVAAFAWLLVIVPALYFVTLVAGAPIRRAAETKPTAILARTAPDGTTGPPIPFNFGASARANAVSATNALAAALLYALSFAA